MQLSSIVYAFTAVHVPQLIDRLNVQRSTDVKDKQDQVVPEPVANGTIGGLGAPENSVAY